MISYFFNWTLDVNWLVLTFPPFFIWFLASVALIGFITRPKKFSKEKELRVILLIGIKRLVRYGWEVLFTSIGLTILTLALHFILLLVNQTLPTVPEFFISTVGFLMIFLIYLGKIKNIATKPPSYSFLNSLKYIYGGFSNPFQNYETYRMK
ncbi:MAG: hypothetical protein ACLFTO_05780 [Candidatus Acetothermia bacterium]